MLNTASVLDYINAMVRVPIEKKPYFNAKLIHLSSDILGLGTTLQMHRSYIHELSINQSNFIMIKITLINRALNASFQQSHFDNIVKATFTLDFLTVIAIKKIMT